MLDCATHTLCKSERLNSMTLISRLFNEPGSHSTTIFPVRAIYKTVERTADSPAVRVLVSVPKRKLHHAVDRNRVKRLVRESYRLNKRVLWKAMEGKDYGLAVAFICLTDTLPDYKVIHKSVMKILTRLSELL